MKKKCGYCGGRGFVIALRETVYGQCVRKLRCNSCKGTGKKAVR